MPELALGDLDIADPLVGHREFALVVCAFGPLLLQFFKNAQRFARCVERTCEVAEGRQRPTRLFERLCFAAQQIGVRLAAAEQFVL